MAHIVVFSEGSWPVDARVHRRRAVAQTRRRLLQIGEQGV